jgi:hypothetical protein
VEALSGIVAAARKLAMLFWCLLSRGEDYAHRQPSLTAQKYRSSSGATVWSAWSEKPPLS